MHKVTSGTIVKVSLKNRNEKIKNPMDITVLVDIIGNKLVSGRLYGIKDLEKHIQKVVVEKFDGKKVFNDQDDEKEPIDDKVVYIQRADPTLEMLAYEIYRNLSDYINGMQYSVTVQLAHSLRSGYCDGIEIKPLT